MKLRITLTIHQARTLLMEAEDVEKLEGIAEETRSTWARIARSTRKALDFAESKKKEDGDG